MPLALIGTMILVVQALHGLVVLLDRFGDALCLLGRERFVQTSRRRVFGFDWGQVGRAAPQLS